MTQSQRTLNLVTPFRARLVCGLIAVGGIALCAGPAQASERDDRKVLADLDTRYQRAVQDNDARTMADILADNFVLVGGDGHGRPRRTCSKVPPTAARITRIKWTLSKPS